MAALIKSKIYRIVDANFNRAKEGLRVCEDVCRFILDEQEGTRRYKSLRHRLSTATAVLDKRFTNLIKERDVPADVGRRSIKTELRRRGFRDIYYANSQRVKESVRVLEECAKLVDVGQARAFKRMRYELYRLEQRVFAKL